MEVFSEKRKRERCLLDRKRKKREEGA